MSNQEQDQVKEQIQSRKMLLGFNDKPKNVVSWFILALQQAAMLYIGMLIVPIMLGGVLGFGPAEVGKMACGCAVASGIASLAQILIGSHLPIMQGPSFGFAAVAMGIFATMEGSAGDKLATYGTALIFGGILEMVIGFTGLLGLLRKLLTPVVTGTVITLIGLGLVGWAAGSAGANWPIAIGMLAIVFFLTFFCSPKVGAFATIIAIAIGYIICVIGTTAGAFGADSVLHVDFTPVKNASWFTFPGIFPWGRPRFNASAWLLVLAPLMASIVESVGDYLAVSQGAGMPEPTKKQYNRGIGAEGIGVVASGLFGGSGVTSYTQNTSLMILSKVASKYVFILASIIVVVLGFIPKLGTLFGTMPDPVMGGVYFASFGLLLGIGIKIIGQGVNMNKDRNITVAGISIFIGMAVPTFLSGSPIVFPNATWLSDILQSVLTTHMIVGGLCAIILDRILPDRDNPAAISEMASEAVRKEEELNSKK